MRLVGSILHGVVEVVWSTSRVGGNGKENMLKKEILQFCGLPGEFSQ